MAMGKCSTYSCLQADSKVKFAAWPMSTNYSVLYSVKPQLFWQPTHSYSKAVQWRSQEFATWITYNVVLFYSGRRFPGLP